MKHMKTHVKAPPQISVAFPAHGSVQLASGSLFANEFRSGAHQHSRPYSSPAKRLLGLLLLHCVRQVWIVMLCEDVCTYSVYLFQGGGRRFFFSVLGKGWLS